jgi:hypothetical protein
MRIKKYQFNSLKSEKMKKLLFVLAIAATIFTACTDDEDPIPVFSGDTLNSNITSDVTLDASVTYKLTGPVKVKTGATLTIPAGTVIKASGGFSSYILVEQGAKIMAEGTASKPIKFTSAASSPAAADWGGLIINGYAPISGPTTTGLTEIDNSEVYGGTDASDNSGVLKYVILEYTGAQSSDNIEHNGLTLNAVGSGTTIENIYITYGGDDAIEFFGGTVSVKNLLVINPDDDMFDCTQGWSGTLDNAYGIWTSTYSSTEKDPRGIEADGNFDGLYPTASGQSNFIMKNITMVNNAVPASDSDKTKIMNCGIKVRRGATATITNALLKGTGKAFYYIDMTDDLGNGNAASSISLTVSGVTAVTSNIKTGTGTFPNVSVGGSNTGATTSAFAWTGYSF